MIYDRPRKELKSYKNDQGRIEQILGRIHDALRKYFGGHILGFPPKI